MTTSVYRLFDSADSLLYVGMTNNLPRRMGAHRRKSWWGDVATIKTREYDDRPAARAEEVRAIRVERPRWNAQNALPPPNLSGLGRLVMVAELVDMFGVTRQAVHQWTKIPEYRFPAPAAVLRMGRIWRTADVVEWAEERGRERL